MISKLKQLQIIKEEIFRLKTRRKLIRENDNNTSLFKSIDDMSEYLIKGGYDELYGYEDGEEFPIIMKHIQSDILDKGKKLTPSNFNSLVMRLENKYDWY